MLLNIKSDFVPAQQATENWQTLNHQELLMTNIDHETKVERYNYMLQLFLNKVF